MQFVLDLDSREQFLELQSPRFESCILKPPTSLVERRALGHFYRRRTRVNAREFVDELLAFYLAPRRRPRELRSLSAADRSRLRLAVIAASGSRRDWRKLYGSHLSADERLFAVMYWRWRSSANQMVVPHGQLEELVAEAQKNGAAGGHLGLDVGGSVLPESLAAQAVAGVRAIDARWASPALAKHVEQLTQLTQRPNLSPLYDARSSSVGMALSAATGTLASSASVDAARAHMETVAPLKGVLEAAAGKLGISASSEVARAHMESVARFDHLPAPNAALAGYHDPIGMKAAVESARSAALRGIDPGGAAVSAARWLKEGAPYASVVGGLSGQGLLDLGHGSPGIAKQLVQFRDKVEQYERGFGLTNDTWQRLAGGFDTVHWAQPAVGRFRELLREQVVSRPDVDKALAVIERFERNWKQRALYFLLGRLLAVCEVVYLRPLAALESPEQVEEALLHALEAVVLDGEFIPALREEVAEAPYLNEAQRINLDHGLEHAAEGDYIRACAPLYPGVEGAFFEVLVSEGIVKRPAGRKRDRIKFHTLLRRLKVAPTLKTFATQVAFDGSGNDHRHGSAVEGHRRQVLFLIAALAGWFEQFAGARMLDNLVDGMVLALPAAVNWARVVELPPR